MVGVRRWGLKVRNEGMGVGGWDGRWGMRGWGEGGVGIEGWGWKGGNEGVGLGWAEGVGNEGVGARVG